MGVWMSLHPQSPTSHLPWGHIWARGSSMGRPENRAPEQGVCKGVCTCSEKMCTLSNSSLSPRPPRAGNVAFPTALALAEDPRHGKP